MSVLATIGVLALLITVHELGHFLAARLQGIYANRFSIGFGPVVLKYQGKQTEYAIRAFPLGGFVGFPDDDPDSEIAPDDPNLLRNRPVADRAIVISAGVIANLVFAYFVLVSQFGLVGVPNGFNYQPGVVIPQVVGENSAAAVAGIQAGDIILRADNLVFEGQDGGVQALVDKISRAPEETIELEVQRGRQTLLLTVVPDLTADGQGRIGVQLAPNGTLLYRRPEGLVEVFALAGNQFQDMLFRIIQGFQMLITNFQEMASQVASPVKIVEWGANIAEADSGNLFFFAAFVSINLAVVNILPLPALDGGQLVFLIIEGLRGRPLPTQVQEGVMQTGFLLLVGLGVFLIIRDTAQLPVLQQLFQ
ncbi:MAG: RIP metalloprotease RseP [Prochlorothrix sp.]|nr:RIP metalloprotease RseP [Prochlorothrix sp.]